mmetsp:Transcript_38246/g.118206  ORF Transcript_38246/g.118206 Transcript_38246/m.118206 type:complete len:124 (-) Transcript_38246:628-999(-)
MPGITPPRSALGDCLQMRQYLGNLGLGLRVLQNVDERAKDVSQRVCLSATVPFWGFLVGLVFFFFILFGRPTGHRVVELTQDRFNRMLKAFPHGDLFVVAAPALLEEGKKLRQLFDTFDGIDR